LIAKTRSEKSAKRRRLKIRNATWAQFPTARPIVDDLWRKVYEGGREVLNCKTELGRQAYKIRTLMMAERQGWICALTGEQLTAENVTFDHQRGRCSGRRDDRISLPDGTWINAAVTWKANSEKGSKRVPYLPHATRPRISKGE
jgi:hypothetical protein